MHRAEPPCTTSESHGRLGAPQDVRVLAKATTSQVFSASCTFAGAMRVHDQARATDHTATATLQVITAVGRIDCTLPWNACAQWQALHMPPVAQVLARAENRSTWTSCTSWQQLCTPPAMQVLARAVIDRTCLFHLATLVALYVCCACIGLHGAGGPATALHACGCGRERLTGDHPMIHFITAAALGMLPFTGWAPIDASLAASVPRSSEALRILRELPEGHPSLAAALRRGAGLALAEAAPLRPREPD